jgi:hypothetical protein
VEVLREYSNPYLPYHARFNAILAARDKPSKPRPPRKSKPPKTHKLQHRLTPADRQDIADRYQAGWSAQKLATKYGVARASITNLLRRDGIQIRQQGKR